MTLLSVDAAINHFALVVLDPDLSVKAARLVEPRKIPGASKAVQMETAIREILEAGDTLIRTWRVARLCGEMPVFGAKSSAATISLTAAATCAIALSATHRIPALWASPREVKQHFAGDPVAEKSAIMDRVIRLYQLPTHYREVNGRYGPRRDLSVSLLGTAFPAGRFHHIADAIAAAHVCLALTAPPSPATVKS